MLISREVFLMIGIGVLVASALALILKVMLLALVIDDWFELRQEKGDTPEKLVANDELWSSVGRVISVLLTITIGATWVIVAALLPVAALNLTPLTFVVASVTIGQAVLADIQGVRSLLFRRRIARLMSGSRRPIAVHAHERVGEALE